MRGSLRVNYQAEQLRATAQENSQDRIGIGTQAATEGLSYSDRLLIFEILATAPGTPESRTKTSSHVVSEFF